MLKYFILSIFFALLANSFEIKPYSLKPVGYANAGEYFWKPTRAVIINNVTAALRILLSKFDCNPREENDDSIKIKENSKKENNNKEKCKFGIIYTTDAGKTFLVEKSSAFSDFCGSGGVVSAESATITCVTNRLKVVEEKKTASHLTQKMSFESKKFTFLAGGIISNPKVTVSQGPDIIIEYPNITFIATELDNSQLSSPSIVNVYFGDTVAFFSEKNIYGRNIEFILDNGARVHSFYKSTDNGLTWTFTSNIPFLHGVDSSLHVLGSTKVMILAGEPKNYSQSTSVFLGNRWEKIEHNLTYATPLSSYISPYNTVIYGGLNGRPGLIGLAAGTKSKSEKILNFAEMHNELIGKMEEKGENFGNTMKPLFSNFSEDFLKAKDWGDCEKNLGADDLGGCATTSYAAVIAFYNSSFINVFYDKTLNGYSPAVDDMDQSVYCMRLFLNESTEIKAHLNKLEEEFRAEEIRKQYETQRAKAKKEMEERERQKRREKRRKDKARRLAFAEYDLPNIEEAKRMKKVDNDLVVIREVKEEFVSLEKETFFDQFPKESGVN